MTRKRVLVFIRTQTNGSRTYLLLVENERINGRLVQRVLHRLGRLDELQASGQLDTLVRSLGRFATNIAILDAHAKGATTTTATRTIGPGLIFERLWRECGIQAVLHEQLATRRFGFDVERAIFLTVLHRLIAPGSDRAAERWKQDYAVAGTEALGLHQLYRAMRWLGTPLPAAEQVGATPFAPRTRKDRVEEALFAHRRDLFDESLHLVFFDTTSIYFEGAGGQTLGHHGHSKDHRPDLRQMVVGLVLDADGQPVCTEMWPGNTTDVKTLIPIVDRLKQVFHVRDVCIVADRGMISAETMAALEDRDWSYILGVRMRSSSDAQAVVDASGAFTEVSPARTESHDPSPLEVKEVVVSGHRYIVCTRTRLRHRQPNGSACSIGTSATPSRSEGSAKTTLIRFLSSGSTMIHHAQIQKESQTERIANNQSVSTSSRSCLATNARIATRGSLECGDDSLIRCRTALCIWLVGSARWLTSQRQYGGLLDTIPCIRSCLRLLGGTVDTAKRLASSVVALGTSCWSGSITHRSICHSDGWYPSVLRLERDGWTTSILRDFERAATPYLVAARPSSRRLGPPPADEDVPSLDTCVEFKVMFPGHDRGKLKIPAEHLARVFETARRGLQRAATLLAETDRKYWRTATLVPGDEPGSRYLNEPSQYLHWVRELFDRLANEHADVARDELRHWPLDEPYFFAKLAIYGYGLAGVADGQAAGIALRGMPDRQFWDESHRRELLHTLRARWAEFEVETRRKLETRIVAGRPRWEGEDDEYPSRVEHTAAAMLGWLDISGCHPPYPAVGKPPGSSSPDRQSAFLKTVMFALRSLRRPAVSV